MNMNIFFLSFFLNARLQTFKTYFFTNPFSLLAFYNKNLNCRFLVYISYVRTIAINGISSDNTFEKYISCERTRS